MMELLSSSSSKEDANRAAKVAISLALLVAEFEDADKLEILRGLCGLKLLLLRKEEEAMVMK